MLIRKILVIDDSETELLVLSTILRQAGYAVATANNEAELYRNLALDRPDLILMDVVMPGKNGFHLTRMLARDPQYSDVPIILCSCKSQKTDRLWGLRQGAKEYIAKPLTINEFKNKLQRLDGTKTGFYDSTH